MSSKYHSEGGRDTVIEIDKLYTPAEAAALIHETVRPAAILRAIQEGRLPAARIGKSKPLVCGADLMTFIEASRCPAPTKALDSNSMVPTTNTGPGGARDSSVTSGTSFGRKTAESANTRRALAIAEKLSGPSRGGSRTVQQ